MDDQYSDGYPHSTEFSGFRFDGFTPAEEKASAGPYMLFGSR
jgi:hypothetical protein